MTEPDRELTGDPKGEGSGDRKKEPDRRLWYNNPPLWINWLITPLTLIVIALGGFICTSVATKNELSNVRGELEEVSADVRMILDHMLNRSASR